ncbi:MAG: undecaprenyl-phosphate glucose phosphotransferase [Rhodothermaceae bacterium]|nr:MAG: undecaprenyl-phosphate glucose phosphotransferase [Rhodothermaceae bacterium]
MSRKVELIVLLVSDALAITLADLLYFHGRFEWMWFGQPDLFPDTQPLYFLLWNTVLAAYWVILFLFFGMYRERYASSRFDELVSLGKVVTVGVLLLIFAVYIDALQPGASRQAIFFYWAAVFGLVSVGRIGVRSVQKALILRGHGTHRALVVGWSDQVEKIYDEVARYPEAGLNVVGAIRLRGDDEAGGDGYGLEHPHDAGVAVEAPAVRAWTIEDLPRLIDELEVQDVLIALGSHDHEPLLKVLQLCDGKPVTLKLVPDFYTLIGGMARTEHMYGLPLIEVLPEPMPPWEQSTKRLIDVLVSAAVLVVGMPAWILIGLLVRLTSPGPAIYRQQRVGQHGRVFTMYKFRTMWQDAEAHTGPVWARENDPRYTPLGRWLRRTRLDEIPQFWNVLRGDMSLVGPRPERPYFVEKLAREIPLYRRRHRVKPGITGWAQVKWKYDESLEDVRQKVKFDLFYIENMSLRMDFKILFRTIRTALSGKGR